jgi:D-lactate dehydrogenase (cytochrome)
MVGRALEMEGTCTGEHAVGLGKKGSLIDELGYDTIDFMKSLKRSVDPDWLMNPSKIFDWDSLGTKLKKQEGQTAASLLERR